MRTLSEFDYLLPEELIAQYPPKNREDARLLLLGADNFPKDEIFRNIGNYLQKNDLLVLNNTKVIPARLFGQKETGGNIEILVERLLSNTQILAQIKASKSPKCGQKILINNQACFQMIDRSEAFFILETLNDYSVMGILEQFGHIPLPPYIERNDQNQDIERYQTVFAQKQGAVAAPTAGLHFSKALLDELDSQGIHHTKLTLHVGAGTFQPVRSENLQNHKMHSEWINVPQETVQKIQETKAKGGRIIAVGTTVVRALESAALQGQLQAFEGDTNIFITEGFEFKVIDGMITNFHLPKSTLLMLVSAFKGYDTMLNAYQYAIKNKYRFFSYGDAMLLTR